MRNLASVLLLLATLALTAPLAAQPQLPGSFARDPHQPIDQAYTAKIQKYTTEPTLNSPLTDYLPASSTVPTPEAVLGDIAGAPNMLPYSAQVYRYFRELAKATPRVEVFSIGKTEEGREMIAVAVSSAKNLARRKANGARLAELADPRTIGMNDAKAREIERDTVPVYYITGTIHSPETGAPTALMELAYRLAVDNSPYIRNIRKHVITLITPITEVDGRDRMVDIYRWHRAHLKENWPHLVYWGHYVAHDNNRDALTVTLDLTRHVLDTYVGWHAQVLHDLHESVPFLYDNTVGDGPYNAWVDPILTNEWQLIGWYNVAAMTKLGMPGVFTHGQFDTWSPGYLMFIAAMHNGISRLYETFGNGGADTEKRVLRPDQYARTWYRQNPPYPTVLWSQRDNNNYEETGLLVSLAYFADNSQRLLDDFYLKSKRSILKPENSGPAAYVLPADDPRTISQGDLLEILRLQHCEISRTEAPVTIKLSGGASAADHDGAQAETTVTRTFPAGSFVIRMDQPYSRIADALLDHQYWSPDDPQRHPYDDTGWTLGDLFNVEVARVTDTSILKAPMKLYEGPLPLAGTVGGGPVFLASSVDGSALASLRYALPDASIAVTEAGFSRDGTSYPAGTAIVSGVGADALKPLAAKLGIDFASTARAPQVAEHSLAKPRIAILHTWLDTQSAGWWRETLDRLGVPYTVLSTQKVAADPNLRAKFDVILFPPVGFRDPKLIVTGLPMWGNPLPWEKTALTPNLGRIDSTPDLRPGLGFDGLAHLQKFVEDGGLLVAAEDTARLLIDEGFAAGVTITPRGDLEVAGSVLGAQFVDAKSPVAYGYGDRLPVYSSSGMSFEVSNMTFGGWRRRPSERPTGRGSAEGHDIPQGRPYVAPPPAIKTVPWEAPPLSSEQMRNNPTVIPPDMRPRVILRFADAGSLLISGLLDHGSALAGRPAVVDSPLGKGHLLLFAINPVWRGETVGSYPLVTNAILSYDHLGTVGQ